MLTSMWCMSIATLLAVDVRTRALQQKDDPLHHTCHHRAANGTGSESVVTVVECAGDRPLCATFAISPNFTSGLTCAAASKSPCSLTSNADVYTLVCTCEYDMCNLLFSKNLQRQLIDFTSSNFTKINSSDYTEAFFKTHYVNVTQEKLYKAITVEVAHTAEKPVQNSSHPSTVASNTHTTTTHPVHENLPRAEAFKHEPTALSEDDEDASEGSGAYEETRTQRQPASDPADPSSFLPANENKAPPLDINVLAMPILFNLIFFWA